MENKVLTITEALSNIQSALKVGKDKQATDRSGRKTYTYRSAENILEKVKPLLKENGVVLTLADTIEAVGNRMYVKSTATISNGKDSISVSAFARESEQAQFMSEPQFTGACSSYARKYALCGLFLLDDGKDMDDFPATSQGEETLQDLKIKLAKELEFLGVPKSQMVAFLQYSYIDVKSKEGIKAFLDDENHTQIIADYVNSIKAEQK